MSTKELAVVLGVEPRTVQLAVQKLGLAKILSQVKIRGQNSYMFTEEHATLIKQHIQKHHNLQSRQIDSVTTEYEENQTILNALSILQNRANEYKRRMEAAESVVNRIASSNGLKTVKEVADILGYGEKSYFSLLRGEGILFRDNGINLPKREYIDRGYFEVKEEPYERNGATFVYSRIYVTAKGLLWLEKKTPKRA